MCSQELLELESALREARMKAHDEARDPTLRELIEEAEKLIQENEAKPAKSLRQRSAVLRRRPSDGKPQNH